VVWRDRHERLWAIGVLFAALALCAMALNDPTVWIGDNRFEMFQNPGRRLGRMFSIWDADRGFGTFAAEVWIGNTVPLWLMRSAGLSIAVTQHLWHAFLLTLAGVSTVAFLRCFRPRIGVAHVAAGLGYMFGPYAVGFLLPSNLFQQYAATPLLLLLAHRGIHGQDRWRTAAAFALTILLLGMVDTPGLLYAGVYLAVVVLYAILVDRSATLGGLVRWGVRVGPLTLLAMAAPIFAAAAGQELFEQNLRETESPLALNASSSWSESWRGLGGWLLYFRDQTGIVKPQVGIYLDSPITLLATFAVPIMAVAFVMFSKARERLLFGMLMIVGLVLMVGQYPLDDPSPFGRLVRWVYDVFPRSQVLRSTYKAGSGAMLGTVLLAALGLEAGLRRTRRVIQARAAQDDRVDPRLAWAPALGVGLVALLVSQPFWRGELYENTELESIPGYVEEAFAWVDAQPGDGRVMILPRANRAEFRWGNVNDDVLDAMLRRPHLIEVPIHLSRPLPATVLTAFDATLDEDYEPGQIAASAIRLGLDHIVIRNDMLWEEWELPRPASFAALREDPSLELVATFGEPGENTTSSLDRSNEAEAEATLAPIEVYRIRDPGSMMRVVPPAPSLLVSGDGAAWPALNALGLLDDPSTGVRFTGAEDAARLGDLLDEGSPLVITDSNRRRADLITLTGRETHTLAADAEIERTPYDLFSRPGAETVVSYGDVDNVENMGTADPTGLLQPWFRPGAAIDGDPDTAWYAGQAFLSGEGIRLVLGAERPIGEIRVHEAVHPDAERRLRSIRIGLGDGTHQEAEFVDGVATADFEGAETSWIEIEIERVTGAGGGYVGYSEIEIEGLRLEERIVAPTDVVQLAATDATLAVALEDAPIAYLFERSIGTGDEPEERTMHRRFVAPSPATVQVSGSLAVDSDMADRDLAGLLGDEIVTAATTRLDGRLIFGGQSAVDGTADTAWAFAAGDEAAISLGFAPVPVRSISVDVRVGSGLASISQLQVDDGEATITVDVPESPCDRQCEVEVEIPMSGRRIGQVDLAITEVAARSASSTVRVDEIRINGAPNMADAASSACTSGLLAVNGDDVTIRMIEPSRRAILTGQPLAFEGCGDPVALAVGDNDLDGSGAVLFDDVFLAPADFGVSSTSTAVAPTIEVTHQSRTAMRAVVDAPEGGTFVLTQSWHPAWTATVDGESLGPPRSFDTFVAWDLPVGTSMEIEVTFGLQRWFRFAWMITFLVAAAALVLLLGLPRPRRRVREGE
jgi:arabinofuranan 3-O-arabinosyltransferase